MRSLNLSVGGGRAGPGHRHPRGGPPHPAHRDPAHLLPLPRRLRRMLVLRKQEGQGGRKGELYVTNLKYKTTKKLAYWVIHIF